MKTPEIIVISGPTASGKTELAISLARQFNGEIINCDSVQIYKDFTIGSAKPSGEQLKQVKHYLIDYLEPNQEFSAGDYQKVARGIVSDIQLRGKLPIVVGGSTLYLKSLLYDFSVVLGKDKDIRAELEKKTLECLVAELREFSSEVADKIDLENPRRVIRALELLIQGELPEKLIENTTQPPISKYQSLIIIPKLEREQLYLRINQRVRQMISEGLIEETTNIIEKYGIDCPALKSIGYRQVVEYLNKKSCLLDELIEEVAQSTRHYAKRQLTFWRNEPEKLKLQEISNVEDSFLKVEINKYLLYLST